MEKDAPKAMRNILLYTYKLQVKIKKMLRPLQISERAKDVLANGASLLR